MSIELKRNIENTIKEFNNNDLFDASINLFNKLGYNTTRQNRDDDNSFNSFKDSYIDVSDVTFNQEKALTNDWQKVELLFQLTNEEVTGLTDIFSSGKFDKTIIKSYLFFAIELKVQDYSRTKLSAVTREINKLFSMPVMVLFFYDGKLTLSVINRRLHQRDSSKDVLEKVTQIKDIRIENPHRAHIEILYDLSFPILTKTHKVTNFVELHRAWEKILDTKELNKKFFKELSNWYFWAVSEVEFPDDAEKERVKRNPISVIRLITRLMFVWFIKEKNLVHDKLFDKNYLNTILNYNDVTGSTYYKAILQNLFFATLNTEMNKDKANSRKFINGQHLVHNLYRYGNLFNDKTEALKLFENIPFLNGGLFECLDRKDDNDNVIRIDCFSENPKNQKRLKVPDYLFFGEEQIVDLSEVYGNKKKDKEKVKPVIEILNSYKFTIDENTPIEEEIALDPELLGRVFENLLANYNPETKTTARKQTGSFYTPREIVNYMVDESLIAYFKTKLGDNEEYEAKLRQLFEYNEEPHRFDSNEVNTLIKSIDEIKILDPAAGSGAFPMGILHRLVFLLHKLDPHNEKWKQKQIDKINEIEDPTVRKEHLESVEDSFTNNELNYGRKLYLIENCIYGVDIQPVAVQIAKLRFFISLVVDQKVNTEKKNYGIRPLPNLETKFVAANTLIGLEKEEDNLFTNPEIDGIKKELKNVRHRYFTARTHKTKEKYRKKDKELREKLSALLTKEHYLQPKDAIMLSNWDPYDQNASSPFFDTEWMFGTIQGFDVVIGNPPYVNFANLSQKQREHYKRIFKVAKNKTDLYAFFIEKSYQLIKCKAILSFIIPHTWKSTDSFTPLRKLIFDNFKFVSIVDLNYGVFEATVKPVVIVIEKKCISLPIGNYYKIKILNANFLEVNYIKSDEIIKSPIYNFDTLSTQKQKKLYHIIESKGHLLNTIVEFSRGIKTSNDERFIKNNKANDDCFKVYRGRNIKPFKLIWGNEYIWYRPDLMKEKVGCVTYKKSDFEVSEKIVLQRISKCVVAAYDNKQQYFIDTVIFSRANTFNEKHCSLKALCSILNSQLVNFWFNGKYRLPTVGIYELHSIPIVFPNSSFDNVLSILCLILSNNSSKEKFFILINNALVFNLYFPGHMKEREIDILKYVEEDINQVMQGREFKQLPDPEKEKVIETLHKKWTAPESIVRKRIELMPIKSPDIIKPILES